jgi:hypothetical protein
MQIVRTEARVNAFSQNAETGPGPPGGSAEVRAPRPPRRAYAHQLTKSVKRTPADGGNPQRGTGPPLAHGVQFLNPNKRLFANQ